MDKKLIKSIVQDYKKKGHLEDRTLGEALEEWSEEYKDKTALVDEYGYLSYQGLWKEVYNLALLFTNNGIRKKDNVIVQLPNCISFVKVCFALFLMGARPILMLQSHGKLELESVSSIAKPKAIVTSRSFLGVDYENMALELKKKTPYIKKIFIDGKSEAGININNFNCEEFNIKEIIDKPESSDIALFLLSGGTTGIPKIIPKIHTAYLCNAKESAKRCDVTEDSVYLAVLSISHDYPLCCPGVIGTLAKGGKCVLCKTASLEEAGPYIKDENVTFVSMAPVLAKLWMDSFQWFDDIDFSSLKYVLIGASKLDYDLATKVEEVTGAKIIQGYGLGEGITCFTSSKDDKKISWSCQGKPISSGDEVRIVDENDNDVKPGEAGELIEKGPYTFLGYYKAPELNKLSFTKDGFFKTGDKAMITPEGNILILGRVKEQINRAGENIIPEEIETLIKQCEHIKEVAVIGIPDDELNERICSVAVKEDKEITLGELCRFLSSLDMAKFKLPDQLVYVEQLPYKNVGKVDKAKLKKELIDKKL